jgi:hypothetical protein
MPLDVNKPTDQALVNELPYWIRAIHAYINALEDSIPSGSFIARTILSIPAGSTSLSIGTQLSDAVIEIIFASGVGAAVLEAIYGGTNGQIKIFIFTNSVVSFKDGTKAAGKFYLNQLPILSNFNAQEGDVLILANVGGDGSTNFGWWKELYRQIAVK